MAKLCILAHPGGEHIADNPGYPKNVGFFGGLELDDIKNLNEGFMPWNTAPKHRRKFIKTNGDYLDEVGNLYTNAGISFWGEWEQESTFVKVDQLFGESPERIHYPQCIKTDVTDFLIGGGEIDMDFVNEYAQAFINKQNTDPYVFGDRFYYSCCRQDNKRNEEKSFLHLNEGDLILFVSSWGKKEKKNRMCVLDTVFVVGGRVLPGKIRYQSELNTLRARVSPQYMNGVLLPICFGNKESNNTALNVLYYGRMYDCTNKDEMFSFFPCRKDCSKNGFDRYVLYDEHRKKGIWYKERIDNVQGKPINSQQASVTQKNDADLKAFWNCLKADVLNSGYLLGVKAYEPPFKEKYIVENELLKCDDSRQTV